ncbi:MAG: hypothetical protein E6R03_02490 [Hyphomicrobiaceae bacterium]|nr:MAG: hypothetical protein E6R03_02490 [Hyphomicrobiaceae bacterium]
MPSANMLEVLRPINDLLPACVLVDQTNQKVTAVDPTRPDYGISIILTQLGDPVVTRMVMNDAGEPKVRWGRVCRTEEEYRRVVCLARNSDDVANDGPRDAHGFLL